MKVVVYKQRWLLDFIADKVARTSVTNQHKLEDRIHRRVAKYLEEVDDAHKHRNYLKKLVFEEIKESKKLYRQERATLYDDLAVDNEQDGIQFEPEDTLASVGDRLIVNETIAGLASDDRKSVILTEWSKGTTDINIARALARQFGGNVDSYARSIRRFRLDCRAEFSA